LRISSFEKPPRNALVRDIATVLRRNVDGPVFDRALASLPREARSSGEDEPTPCEWHVGGEVIHAKPGAYVFIPPGVLHNIVNASDKPVRMIMSRPRLRSKQPCCHHPLHILLERSANSELPVLDDG